MSSSNESIEDITMSTDNQPIEEIPTIPLLYDYEPAEARLEGWNRHEKSMLLAALKLHGSHKVKEISFHIPTKTGNEIKAAIEYYKNKAFKAKAPILPQCTKRPRRSRQRPRIPLAQWVKFLTDTLSYSELYTETVNALRLLAKFEDIPRLEVTDQIDFVKVYHQIADAMEGKSLIDNRLTIEVINFCILDVVVSGRTFIKPTTFKFLLNSIKLEQEKPLKVLHPSKDNELNCLQHLLSQKNYNPLNIPEEYLTPLTQNSAGEE